MKMGMNLLSVVCRPQVHKNSNTKYIYKENIKLNVSKPAMKDFLIFKENHPILNLVE